MLQVVIIYCSGQKWCSKQFEFNFKVMAMQVYKY